MRDSGCVSTWIVPHRFPERALTDLQGASLPAETRSGFRCGFQAARVLIEDSVRRPWVGYDHVGSRIPIAVLIDAGVEAVSIIDIHLRKLNRTIGRNFHG